MSVKEAALKARMCETVAYKYLRLNRLPSEMKSATTREWGHFGLTFNHSELGGRISDFPLFHLSK